MILTVGEAQTVLERDGKKCWAPFAVKKGEVGEGGEGE